MIDFKCQRCRQELSVPDSLVGQQEKCPYCGRINIVPSPEQAARNPLARQGPTSLDTISSWLQGPDFSSMDLNVSVPKKKPNAASRPKSAPQKDRQHPQS